MNEGTNNLLTVAAIVAGVVACAFFVTSCEKQAEVETTKRQWIAGTNVVHRENPFVIPH